MTRRELNNYISLKKSITQNKELRKKYQQQLANVPTIKTKVQSSQKEWPYIETHITVEANEPIAYNRIQRLIEKNEKALERMTARELELESDILDFVESLENIRDRYIIKAVFIQDRDQREVAIDLDLTEGRVSQIIKEILDTLN